MSAVFMLDHDQDTYRFSLLNDRGEQLLIGAEFENREEAEKAIKEVRLGSLMSQQIAAGKVASGETFFVIKNELGQIIAKSLLFDNQMAFDASLHNVKENACIAEIKEPA